MHQRCFLDGITLWFVTTRHFIMWLKNSFDARNYVMLRTSFYVIRKLLRRFVLRHFQRGQVITNYYPSVGLHKNTCFLVRVDIIFCNIYVQQLEPYWFMSHFYFLCKYIVNNKIMLDTAWINMNHMLVNFNNNVLFTNFNCRLLKSNKEARMQEMSNNFVAEEILIRVCNKE